MSTMSWLTIRQLDKQLKEWKTIGKKYGRPSVGWIKVLRQALSMSVNQLANRLGLSRERMTQLENAEVNDAVSLRTLRRAANAMDCELVYAIVPKGGLTLERIIMERAERMAAEKVTRVAHSMSLEAQTVDANELKSQQKELAKNLMENLNKKFWAEVETQKGLTNPKKMEKFQQLLRDRHKRHPKKK